MKKTKTNIFFDSKLVFAKRKEGELWEEEKRDDKGMGVSESVISEFEEYYNPENLESAIEHPDEIIHGVRDRMMQGPFGARNILSGGSILERRVHSSLEDTRRNAPTEHKQLIDAARRVGVPGSIFDISRNMFTYDIEAGDSYEDLITNLQANIMALGHIGLPGFTDSNGQRINLANPTQTNEFDVVAGAPGVSGNVRVVIRWHQEDLTTIRQKLEQAGMWADFSRQPGAREFLHLKFRQTLIQRTAWKEKTKLSKDKFDPQRLKSWLDDELHARALADPDYVTWFAGWPGNAAPSMAALTPAQRNELTRAQREARERVYENSLEAKLKKILIPGQIENVTKSLETKTMLSYLFYKMSQNNEDRENVENFIDELAGVDYEGPINTLDSVSEKKGEFLKDMGPKMEARKEKSDRSKDLQTEITTLTGKAKKVTKSISATKGNLTKIRKSMMDPALNQRQIPAIKAQAEILVKQIDLMEKQKTGIEEKIETLKKEKTTIDAELAKMETELMRELGVFGKFIKENAANTNLWGGLNINITALDTSIGSIKDCNDLANFLTDPAKIKEIKDVIKDAEKRKAHFENLQKNRPGAAGKMDSRGLLYKLVKRDIELKGVTADPNLENEALITTNILIAQSRNQEIYGNVNQNIATRIEQGHWSGRDEWINSKLFFSPDMTGADAIEHICDIDSDLNKLKGLNINSTPADIIRIMQENNMMSVVKLRDLQKKLSELIRGFFTKEKGTIKIVSKDAHKVEKFINNLVIVESRLNAENRIQEVSEGFYDPSKSREDQILEMLQNQTSDDIETDSGLANELEKHDSKFKRFFLKDELSKEYKAAMKELEGLPEEEIEEELRRRGLTARVRSRGILSLRAARFIKKSSIAFLKYNPLTLAGIGIFKAGSWFYDYAKSIIWTEQTKERTARIREKYKGGIIEPTATVIVGWPLAIGAYVVSRPKTWIRKITNWGDNKMS